MKEPLIFDINRASTTDGPGIRTTVFFKGCNLDCFWCHNPESKSPRTQLAIFADKCVGCGSCESVCGVNREECISCGRCSELCPTGARKLYGGKYSPDELFEIIKADKLYYDATGGGVTFSGAGVTISDAAAGAAGAFASVGAFAAVDPGLLPLSAAGVGLPS